MPNRWLQIRGDPSIRQFLFSQSRVNNEFDNHLDTVLETVEALLCTAGAGRAFCAGADLGRGDETFAGRETDGDADEVSPRDSRAPGCFWESRRRSRCWSRCSTGASSEASTPFTSPRMR